MRYLLIILLFACNDSPKQDDAKPVPVQVNPKPVPVVVVPKPEPILNWADQRPIGMVMLSNYREWTGTDNYMTDDFASFANDCINTMRDINAQGCIVWDAGGSKFPRAYTYYGDPTLAPDKVDTFFSVIKAAGFRTGICIRPDSIVWRYTEQMQTISPLHYTVASPYKNMKAKIEYARQRWGCTLFYVDSNIGEGQGVGVDNTQGYGKLIPAVHFSKLAKDFPDCLIIPEWSNDEYFPYTIPYYHTGWEPPSQGRYVINTGDTQWSIEQLKKAIDQGHILMGRVFWSGAPELSKIKQAYEKD